MTARSKRNSTPSRYALRRHLYQGRQFMSTGAKETQPDQAAAEDTRKLNEDLLQLRDLALRQKAEFENFRKRTQRDKDMVRDAAAEAVLFRLLPVVDNMERALAGSVTATDIKSVRDGVSMILTQLTRALESEGLAQIDALNQPFDPTRHDALATEERNDVSDNHVCEVMLPGYVYKEKVIRAAMVKVARQPGNEEKTN